MRYGALIHVITLNVSILYLTCILQISMQRFRLMKLWPLTIIDVCSVENPHDLDRLSKMYPGMSIGL